MAPCLREQGYEPKLMILVSEKLKTVIDHETQRSNSIDDPSEKSQIELCLVRLRKLLEISYSLAPIKFESARQEQVSPQTTWYDDYTQD